MVHFVNEKVIIESDFDNENELIPKKVRNPPKFASVTWIPL